MTTTNEVPGKWPIGINGRGYQLADKSKYESSSIPLLRQQSDDSPQPGSRSLNPEGFWRRGMAGWHHGGGQAHRDLEDSDPFRFFQSIGVDVWDRTQLIPLSGTTQKRSSANANLQVMAANATYTYMIDGQNLRFTSDASGTYTWTDSVIRVAESAVTLNARSTGTQMATDGATVYCVFPGDGGIHTTTIGAGSSSHYADAPASRNYTSIAFVKGRLMAGGNQGIYNITGSGAAPSSLYDHPNASLRWRCFAEGPTHIYAAGDDGYTATIMKMAVKADGTGIDVPSNASPGLPPGETVQSMLGYVGFLFLGTSRGVRMCSIDGDGNLTIGGLIRNTSPDQPDDPSIGCGPNYALFAYGQFVYCGLEELMWNYSAVSGLTRLNLETFVAPLVPAYATDVYTADSSSSPSSACLHRGTTPMFAVPSTGVYVQGGTAPTSKIDSGLITYELTDSKVPIELSVHSTIGSYTPSISTDGGSFTSLGSQTGSQDIELDHTAARSIEVQLSIPSGTAIYDWNLKSEPAADSGYNFIVPLELSPHVVDNYGTPGAAFTDPITELNLLKALRDARTVFDYQEYGDTYSCILTDIKFQGYSAVNDGTSVEGVALCKLKLVSA